MAKEPEPSLKTLLLPLLVSIAAAAQPTPGSLTFDVASVKPSSPGEQGIIWKRQGLQFAANKVSLRRLITIAFQVRDAQVVAGPPWIDTAKFDVVAKSEQVLPPGSAESARQEMIQAMLRNLLNESFGLSTHNEVRTMPVFALGVGKNGPKLTPTDGNPYAVTRQKKSIRFHNTSMTDLARLLSDTFPSDELGAMVQDETGLPDHYDYILHWIPAKPINGTPDSNMEAPPPIFSALAELGLKLTSKKAPVTVLIIDKADQPSSLF